jgi:hypothetical protein
VLGSLRRAREFFTFAPSIGHLSKRSIINGQRQLQKLKAQVDELNQRLRSIESMTAAVSIELSGPGPFRLPLLTRLNSLVTEVEDQLVTEFVLQDGKQIYATIPYLAAAEFVNDDLSLPPRNVMVHPSTSIDFGKPTDAFRLPVLSSYEGHFYADRDIRVLIFLTQDGRRVFFPLPIQTYVKLLQQVEAALMPYQQAKISEAKINEADVWTL